MRKLTKLQFNVMDEWMHTNARPYDTSKWDYLFNGCKKDNIVNEMLKYQNPDGGIGKGFEADILCPLSAAIPTAEAIFQAYEYNLDCNSQWFGHILTYFENTVQDISSYWEPLPKKAMAHPHAPWWDYTPCIQFSPNPCAVVASALIRYGTDSQKVLGYSIANDCIKFLLSNNTCMEHDTLNIQALVEQLLATGSPLITDNVMIAMKKRILENTCFDVSQYNNYYFTPLDYVFSPDSVWYDTVKHGIGQTFDFWLDSINNEGVWTPNFSWGVDNDTSNQVNQKWTGYITVKRAKILLNFGKIER